MDAVGLMDIISKWQLPCRREKDFQDCIAEILRGSSIEFDREFKLCGRDIIDFRIGRVGLECKVKGAKNSVLSQLIRYAESDQLDEILLVTTKFSHVPLDGEVVQGKLVRVYWSNNM